MTKTSTKPGTAATNNAARKGAKGTTAAPAAKVTTKAPKAAPAKVDPDAITTVSAVKSGEISTIAVTAGKQTLMIKADCQSKTVIAAAAVGKSLSALAALVAAQKLTAQPTMARGLTSRAAPHSAKAVSDTRAKAAPAPAPAKAPAKAEAKAPAKAPAPAPAKADKPAKVSGSLAAKRITALLKVADIKARPESFRYAMLKAILASKTVADFYAKDTGAFHSKFDAGCVRFSAASGYVALAD